MGGTRSLWLVALGALLVTGRGAAEPPPPAKRVITMHEEQWWSRASSSLTTYRRVLEGARLGLTACHELVLSDTPRATAEIDASMTIGPNGEVETATLTTAAAIPDASLACFRRRLVTLSFDPPGGGGVILRVALLLGDPAPVGRPSLPFHVGTPMTKPVLGPVLFHLTAKPPAPSFRAVRAAAAAVKACAQKSPPTAPIVLGTRLLVADTGEIAELAVTSEAPGGEAIVRCVADATWPRRRGLVARVDLRLAVAVNGEVSLAP